MWIATTEPYQNINFIFPTKQKAVGKIVRRSREDENIRRVTVFGSATMNRCNLWSDIDLFFEFYREPFRYPSTRGIEEVFDKFNNFSVSKEFWEEIKKDGVIVYERHPEPSHFIGYGEGKSRTGAAEF